MCSGLGLKRTYRKRARKQQVTQDTSILLPDGHRLYLVPDCLFVLISQAVPEPPMVPSFLPLPILSCSSLPNSATVDHLLAL